MGTIYKRGNVWWIRYFDRGRQFFESSHSDKHGVAKDLLKEREGDITRGVPVSPKAGRILVDELLEDVVTDYRVNRRRSLGKVEQRIKTHLLPYFRGRRASEVTGADLRRFVEMRQAQPLPRNPKRTTSNAEINRELAIIRRGFNLAVRSGKLHHKPHVDMLKESAPRSGFLERDQFEAVRAQLADPLKPMMTLAYVTGWRIDSEVLPLTWRLVDFKAGRVFLDPSMTKNGKPREFPFTRELRAVLEAQRTATDALERATGQIVPWVFHRNGKPIRSFAAAWAGACKRAGLVGRIPHDTRRSAVRNLTRAGVVETVAQKLTGHLTRSVFDRYNIVSEGDLVNAAAKLDATVTETVTVGRTADLAAARRRKKA